MDLTYGLQKGLMKRFLGPLDGTHLDSMSCARLCSEYLIRTKDWATITFGDTRPMFFVMLIGFLMVGILWSYEKLIKDPCPSGSPEIMTVAPMSHGQHSFKEDHAAYGECLAQRVQVPNRNM